MLTQSQKVAIRRHLGVPFAGTAQAGRLYGWRFTWYREDLEYRMNNLQPSEEQLISGASLGSYRIDGRPTVGDVLTLTVTPPAPASPIVATYAVQQSDFALPANPVNPSESSPLYSIALNAAKAVNALAGASGYYAAGVMPADLFAPAFVAPYFAEVQVLGPKGVSFTISAAIAGTTNFGVDQPVTASPVRLALPDPVTGSATPCYGYIDVLDSLAMLMGTANLSLQYKAADVVDFRADEVAARRGLYREYCAQLERALGGERYIQKFGGSGGGGAVA